MSFSNFTDLPALSSYERALGHYHSIKPLRGKTEDVRPICRTTLGRRKKHLRILTTIYDGLPAVACRLYNTDVLTYVSDGRVVINNEWPSQSTNSFVSGIAPYGVEMMQRHNETWVFNRRHGGKWYYLPPGGTMELVEPETGMGWHPVKPHVLYKHAVKRAEINAIRKRYQPFIQHCVNVAKLLGVEGYNSPEHSRVPSPDVLLDSTREGWGEATKYFIQTATRSEWHWVSRTHTTELSVTTLRTTIADYMKYEHADEIFEKVPVPAGVCVNDTNARYIGARR